MGRSMGQDCWERDPKLTGASREEAGLEGRVLRLAAGVRGGTWGERCSGCMWPGL